MLCGRSDVVVEMCRGRETKQNKDSLVEVSAARPGRLDIAALGLVAPDRAVHHE